MEAPNQFWMGDNTYETLNFANKYDGGIETNINSKNTICSSVALSKTHLILLRYSWYFLVGSIIEVYEFLIQENKLFFLNFPNWLFCPKREWCLDDDMILMKTQKSRGRWKPTWSHKKRNSEWFEMLQ